MKRTFVFLLPVIAVFTLSPASVHANSGDFSGGVAIGTGYAGVNTAPTNGLIVQGNVGVGTATSVPYGLVIQKTNSSGGNGWSALFQEPGKNGVLIGSRNTGNAVGSISGILPD